MAPAVLPTAALDDRIAIVGTAGSGKTYTAKGFVERLLDAGARVAIVDPLSVWWGLCAGAAGNAGYHFDAFGILVRIVKAGAVGNRLRVEQDEIDGVAEFANEPFGY